MAGLSFSQDQFHTLIGSNIEERVKVDEGPIDLTVGMMVEVAVNKKPYYGVVRWLGTSEVEGKMVDLVGLEMVSFSNFSIYLNSGVCELYRSNRL